MLNERATLALWDQQPTEHIGVASNAWTGALRFFWHGAYTNRFDLVGHRAMVPDVGGLRAVTTGGIGALGKWTCTPFATPNLDFCVVAHVFFPVSHTGSNEAVISTYKETGTQGWLIRWNNAGSTYDVALSTVDGFSIVPFGNLTGFHRVAFRFKDQTTTTFVDGRMVNSSFAPGAFATTGIDTLTLNVTEYGDAPSPATIVTAVAAAWPAYNDLQLSFLTSDMNLYGAFLEPEPLDEGFRYAAVAGAPGPTPTPTPSPDGWPRFRRLRHGFRTVNARF